MQGCKSVSSVNVLLVGLVDQSECEWCGNSRTIFLRLYRQKLRAGRHFTDCGEAILVGVPKPLYFR